MDNEAALLQRARENDPAALGEIYDRYADRMYNYVYARLNHREVAEDITAEIFIKMLEALNKGTFARTALAPWLYRIAHNLVVDHCRKSHRPPLPPDPMPKAVGDPVDVLEARSTQERLCQALGHLTLDQQQVIVLRFGQRMKAPEIAGLLDKSEDAVRALQRRALASLRRVLEE